MVTIIFYRRKNHLPRARFSLKYSDQQLTRHTFWGIQVEYCTFTRPIALNWFIMVILISNVHIPHLWYCVTSEKRPNSYISWSLHTFYRGKPEFIIDLSRVFSPSWLHDLPVRELQVTLGSQTSEERGGRILWQILPISIKKSCKSWFTANCASKRVCIDNAGMSTMGLLLNKWHERLCILLQLLTFGKASSSWVFSDREHTACCIPCHVSHYSLFDTTCVLKLMHS